MEKKCKICGIYEILHKSLSHNFVEEGEGFVFDDESSVNKIQ